MTERAKLNARWLTPVLVVLAIVPFAVVAYRIALHAGNLAAQLEEAQLRMANMVTKEELDSALARAAELEERIARLESPETEVEETSPPGEQGQALLDMFAALSGGGEEGEGTEEGQNPLAQMFSGEDGKKLADYAARMSMDMAFGDFFDELSLPADTESQVRDILAAHMSEQISKGMEAMQSGLDKEKLEQMKEDAEERLREELSRVLNREEMAVYDEYADTMDERMLAQNYDMQLNMYASGMTQENRTLVRDVLVDEMLAIGEERDQDMGMGMGMGMDGDIQAAFNMQLEAFERARETLAGELDDEQLAYFDRFVAAQEQAFEMAAALFGNMAGQEQPEEAEQQ